MSKNVMLLFKLKLFIQKNMLFYLFSHIALSTGLTFGINHYFYKYLRGAAALKSCRAAKYL